MGQARSLRGTLSPALPPRALTIKTASTRPVFSNPRWGVGRADAEWLRERILEAAATRPAVLTAKMPFGILYVLDFLMTTTCGSAVVRTGWIVRHGEDYPRLTTCYVKVGAKR